MKIEIDIDFINLYKYKSNIEAMERAIEKADGPDGQWLIDNKNILKAVFFQAMKKGGY